MKKKTMKNNLKRFFRIGVTMAFVLSAYVGVEASDFVDLEQMIETHSEYELVRNEDGKVIGVNVTNDRVEGVLNQEAEEYDLPDLSDGITLIAERDENGVLQYFSFYNF